MKPDQLGDAPVGVRLAGDLRRGCAQELPVRVERRLPCALLEVDAGQSVEVAGHVDPFGKALHQFAVVLDVADGIVELDQTLQAVQVQRPPAHVQIGLVAHDAAVVVHGQRLLPGLQIGVGHGDQMGGVVRILGMLLRVQGQEGPFPSPLPAAPQGAGDLRDQRVAPIGRLGADGGLLQLPGQPAKVGVQIAVRNPQQSLACTAAERGDGDAHDHRERDRGAPRREATVPVPRSHPIWHPIWHPANWHPVIYSAS